MDKPNRGPDTQPETWLNTPPAEASSLPAEQPPAWGPPGAAPEQPFYSGPATGSGSPPPAPPEGPALYTVPPASPYGTAPGTPYSVPPAYPVGTPPVPGTGIPVSQPSAGMAGYPPFGGMGDNPAAAYPAAPRPGYPYSAPVVPETAEPPTDPSRLRILVAGREPTLPEYEEIARLSSGHGTTLAAAMALLVLLFGWMAIVDAAFRGNRAVISATILLVLASILLLVMGLVAGKVRMDRKRRMVYFTQMADPETAQGRKLEFYDDRIEAVSARGTSVLPFSEVTAYIETRQVIALISGELGVFIRGQDLTAYDAGLIRAFLSARVPAKLVRIKAALAPCLSQPLPIPVLSNRDEVLARAQVPYSAAAERRTRGRRLLSTLPAVLPMLLLLGTAMAQYLFLTNWFLLDTAVFFAGFTAVYLLAGLLFLAAAPRRPTDGTDGVLHLAVTRDGIAFCRKGMAGFAVRACVRPVKASGGVRLILPYTSCFIPESAMEQPAQFRAVLGL